MNTEKEITQLDLSGNIIRKYKSMAVASRVTGIGYYSIRHAKKYGYTTNKKYKWI